MRSIFKNMTFISIVNMTIYSHLRSCIIEEIKLDLPKIGNSWYIFLKIFFNSLNFFFTNNICYHDMIFASVLRLYILYPIAYKYFVQISTWLYSALCILYKMSTPSNFLFMDKITASPYHP